MSKIKPFQVVHEEAQKIEIAIEIVTEIEENGTGACTCVIAVQHFPAILIIFGFPIQLEELT